MQMKVSQAMMTMIMIIFCLEFSNQQIEFKSKDTKNIPTRM